MKSEQIRQNARELLTGSGTPATPSVERLAKSLKESQDAHDAEGRAWSEWMSVAIAAAVAAEREECAKIADAMPRNTEMAGSFQSAKSKIAAAIRSRTSQPAPHIHMASCYKCGHDDCPCHGGYLHELPMCAEGPAAKEGK